MIGKAAHRYRVLLSYRPEQTAAPPRREGRVSVLMIDDGTVTGIEFTDSPARLRAVVGLK